MLFGVGFAAGVIAMGVLWAMYEQARREQERDPWPDPLLRGGMDWPEDAA